MHTLFVVTLRYINEPSQNFNEFPLPAKSEEHLIQEETAGWQSEGRKLVYLTEGNKYCIFLQNDDGGYECLSENWNKKYCIYTCNY